MEQGLEREGSSEGGVSVHTHAHTCTCVRGCWRPRAKGGLGGPMWKISPGLGGPAKKEEEPEGPLGPQDPACPTGADLGRLGCRVHTTQ